MKGAVVLSRWDWAIEPESGEASQQLEVVGEGLGAVMDLTSQFVLLSRGQPDPNVGMAYVREISEDHGGAINALKEMARHMVLAERDEGLDGMIGGWVRALTNAEIKAGLVAAGVASHLADQVIAGESELEKVLVRLKIALSEF